MGQKDLKQDRSSNKEEEITGGQECQMDARLCVTARGIFCVCSLPVEKKNSQGLKKKKQRKRTQMSWRLTLRGGGEVVSTGSAVYSC